MSEIAKNCTNFGGRVSHEFAIFAKKNLAHIYQIHYIKIYFSQQSELGVGPGSSNTYVEHLILRKNPHQKGPFICNLWAMFTV